MQSMQETAGLLAQTLHSLLEQGSEEAIATAAESTLRPGVGLTDNVARLLHVPLAGEKCGADLHPTEGL